MRLDFSLNTHKHIDRCIQRTTSYSSINATMSTINDVRYMLDCCNNSQIHMLILVLFYLRAAPVAGNHVTF